MKEVVIDSVFHAFGKQEVLRGSAMRLQTGQVTGLLGRNGCGKSTLLKILTGGLAADNAYIGINGVHTRHLFQQPGLINYLPQYSCHPPSLSLHKLVALYGLDAEAFFTEFAAFLPEPAAIFGQLSGGQSRLFEILLLLRAPADFTILDEPFSHIMPAHVEIVKKLIKASGKERGMLITDHQYRHVLDLSDTLYLMHSGTTAVVLEKEDLVRLGYVTKV